MADAESTPQGTATEPEPIAAAAPAAAAQAKRNPVLVFAWRIAFFAALYIVTRAAFRYAHDTLQLSAFHMVVTATELWMFVPFWAANAVLTAVDVCRAPHCLYRHKLQPNTRVPLRTHVHIIGVVLLNQFLLSVPLQALAYPLYAARGVLPHAELPPLPVVLRDLTGYILVEEVLFYYSHRLLHVSEWLYRHVHSLHHRMTAPVGAAAMYAHPLEFALSNALPIMCGPLLVGGHVTQMWLWTLIAILSTTNGHSGYAFPFTPFGPAKNHDLHHATFQHNYGAIGLLDWLHGTRRTDAPVYHIGLKTN